MVPWTWIIVTAALSKITATDLTPRQFWLAVARQGGHLGRKSDGRPGRKVIWCGWHDLQMMTQGANLHAAACGVEKCG